MVRWIDTVGKVCISSTCVYRLLYIQNDSSTIRILFNGEELAEARPGRVFGGVYSVCVNTTGLGDGAYELKAVQLIHDRITSTASADIVVDVNPPIINASIDVYGNQTVRVNWSIHDYSGIKSAELLIKGPLTLHKSIGSEGVLTFKLPPGKYTLTIMARDQYSHVGIVSKTFILTPQATASLPGNKTVAPVEAVGGAGNYYILIAAVAGASVIACVVYAWRRRSRG